MGNVADTLLFAGQSIQQNDSTLANKVTRVQLFPGHKININSRGSWFWLGDILVFRMPQKILLNQRLNFSFFITVYLAYISTICKYSFDCNSLNQRFDGEDNGR